MAKITKEFIINVFHTDWDGTKTHTIFQKAMQQGHDVYPFFVMLLEESSFFAAREFVKLKKVLRDEEIAEYETALKSKVKEQLVVTDNQQINSDIFKVIFLIEDYEVMEDALKIYRQQYGDMRTRRCLKDAFKTIYYMPDMEPEIYIDRIIKQVDLGEKSYGDELLGYFIRNLDLFDALEFTSGDYQERFSELGRKMYDKKQWYSLSFWLRRFGMEKHAPQILRMSQEEYKSGLLEDLSPASLVLWYKEMGEEELDYNAIRELMERDDPIIYYATFRKILNHINGTGKVEGSMVKIINSIPEIDYSFHPEMSVTDIIWMYDGAFDKVCEMGGDIYEFAKLFEKNNPYYKMDGNLLFKNSQLNPRFNDTYDFILSSINNVEHICYLYHNSYLRFNKGFNHFCKDMYYKYKTKFKLEMSPYTEYGFVSVNQDENILFTQCKSKEHSKILYKADELPNMGEEPRKVWVTFHYAGYDLVKKCARATRISICSPDAIERREEIDSTEQLLNAMKRCTEGESFDILKSLPLVGFSTFSIEQKEKYYKYFREIILEHADNPDLILEFIEKLGGNNTFQDRQISFRFFMSKKKADAEIRQAMLNIAQSNPDSCLKIYLNSCAKCVLPLRAIIKKVNIENTYFLGKLAKKDDDNITLIPLSYKGEHIYFHESEERYFFGENYKITQNGPSVDNICYFWYKIKNVENKFGAYDVIGVVGTPMYDAIDALNILFYGYFRDWRDTSRELKYIQKVLNTVKQFNVSERELEAYLIKYDEILNQILSNQEFQVLERWLNSNRQNTLRAKNPFLLAHQNELPQNIIDKIENKQLELAFLKTLEEKQLSVQQAMFAYEYTYVHCLYSLGEFIFEKMNIVNQGIVNIAPGSKIEAEIVEIKDDIMLVRLFGCKYEDEMTLEKGVATILNEAGEETIVEPPNPSVGMKIQLINFAIDTNRRRIKAVYLGRE